MQSPYTYLDWVLVWEEVNDLERVRDNADGEELLSVVTTLHHQAIHKISNQPQSLFTDHNRAIPVHETLDNRHLGLLKLPLRVTASSVWEVDGMANLDVIGEGDILDLNTA
jgi:hypothetical protein